jgi:hypothetical protein
LLFSAGLSPAPSSSGNVSWLHVSLLAQTARDCTTHARHGWAHSEPAPRRSAGRCDRHDRGHRARPSHRRLRDRLYRPTRTRPEEAAALGLREAVCAATARPPPRRNGRGGWRSLPSHAVSRLHAALPHRSTHLSRCLGPLGRQVAKEVADGVIMPSLFVTGGFDTCVVTAFRRRDTSHCISVMALR